VILVFGGAAETTKVATTLVEAGFRVLASTLTDFPLDAPLPPGVMRRTGALDAEGLKALVRERRILGIVDVTHPYATEASANARRAAEDLRLPYWRFERPAVINSHSEVIRCETHDEAAKAACSFGKPVLLTTGSRNLAAYTREAKRKRVALIVRVLPTDDSVGACIAAGVPKEHVITGVGPFSVDQNLEIIRKRSIGTLVTKDGGAAGGTPEKLEAARIAGCRVVVVKRPAKSACRVFTDVRELVDAVAEARPARE
jgi:precorrin-6A/cobalt-precorrin-6A reductase